MLQITIHYTENLPSDDSFKTRRFTVELTQDVPDTADINSITERLFVVAKANVEAQVARARGDLALRDMTKSNGNHQPVATPAATPGLSPQSKENGNGNGGSPRLASAKQIKYLLELAKKASWSHDEIIALPAEFNMRRFEELTSHEASALIERFSN